MISDSPLSLGGEALHDWCDARGWHVADVMALQKAAGQATVRSSGYDESRDAIVFTAWDGAETVFERGWLSGHGAQQRTAA